MACDVLLINPPFRLIPPFEYRLIDPPRNLALIAAVLRARGWNVAILDMPILGLDFDSLAPRLGELEPRAVGISNRSTYSFPIVERVAAEVKAWRGEVPVFAGGTFVSFCPEEALRRASTIDFIVVGEGEVTAPLVVQTLLSGGRDLSGIPGVAYRNADGVPVVNLPAPHLNDLKDLPLPALDLLPVDRYVARNERYILDVTRGCTNACAYCTSSYVKKSIRFRPPAQVVEEMRRAYDLGFRSFYFHDDTFTADPAQIQAICRLIIEAGWKIRWPCMTRVDMVDRETLTLMCRAGCDLVAYGIESTAESLRRAGKVQDEAKILAAFDLTKTCGIRPLAFVMFGMPGNTLADEFRTIRFLTELQPEAVGVFSFKPYPGTVYYARPAEHGITIEETDFSRWSQLDEPTHSTDYLTRQEIIEAMVTCNYLFRSGGTMSAGVKYRRRRGVLCLKTGEGGILYNPYVPPHVRKTDMYLNGLKVNPEYFEVLYRCDGYHSIEDIVAVVAKLFDMAPEAARAKVDEVIAAAKERGLIEEIPDVMRGGDSPRRQPLVFGGGLV